MLMPSTGGHLATLHVLEPWRELRLTAVTTVTRIPHLMRPLRVLPLCAALALPGCATSRAGAATPAAPDGQVAGSAVLAEYVQRLPPGSAVRVERAAGRTIRGTLMKATASSVVLQPRTRVPEPPVEIPLAEVLSVTPEPGNGNTVAKAIGIGAAAGAAAALGVFLIILAVLAD